MMRWVMLAVAMLGFALTFGAQSVALLAFGLLLGFGGLVGAFIAFAAARVESVAQTQSSRELSMLLEARKHKAARRETDASSSTGIYAVSGDGGGRGKAAGNDDRTPDGQDGGSDGGGDGGGGGGD